MESASLHGLPARLVERLALTLSQTRFFDPQQKERLLLHSASSKQIRKLPFVTSVFHADANWRGPFLAPLEKKSPLPKKNDSAIGEGLLQGFDLLGVEDCITEPQLFQVAELSKLADGRDVDAKPFQLLEHSKQW